MSKYNEDFGYYPYQNHGGYGHPHLGYGYGHGYGVPPAASADDLTQMPRYSPNVKYGSPTRTTKVNIKKTKGMKNTFGYHGDESANRDLGNLL